MGHDHAHQHFTLPTGYAPEHGRLMKLATYASVSMATALLLAKLYAWWETDSLAMLSSFTDSVFDVFMSLINLFAVRYALKPADDDHRFGHSAIEDIAGLAQCVFIFVAMGVILMQSFERLMNPTDVLANPELGIGVSMLGLVATIALVTFQTYVARKTRSLVIAADRLHYVGDILFNFGVMAAYVLSSYFGLVEADALIAIVIALSVLWANRSIGLRAFNNLMDRELPADEQARILAIVEATEGIRGHHQLRTRSSGVKLFIQLHIDIDADQSFREAHTITERLEHALLTAYPGADVIIHADPVEH